MSDVLATLAGYVTEAKHLREVDLPGPHSGGDALLECLLDIRSRLDRLEEILGRALRLRAAAVARHVAVRHETSEAWDQAAVRARNAGVRDEYASALERTATTNLEVLDLRRAERAADADARACDAAVEQIRLIYRGLADVRQDLHTIVKARQFESTLDR